MSGALLTMSSREIQRATVMQQVLERSLTQRNAAEISGLSLRRMERLYAAYKA